MDLVNGQWKVTYDTSKLNLTTTSASIMPNISDDVVRVNNGTVKGNFTNVQDLYDFSTTKPFVELTFDVIGTGNTDVTLDVQELSVGYLSGSSLNYANAVANSAKVDLSAVSGFTSSAISGQAVISNEVAPTTPVTDDLKVNVTSNFFPTASKTYSANDKEVTVSFMLSSSMDLINTEWALTYDTSKLSFDKSTVSGLMPNASGAIVKESTTGTIKGNFTNLSLVDFKDEKAFVTVTFDVIGSGTANVDMFVDFLGVAYIDSNSEAVEDYIVNYGEVNDVTGTPGFENEVYTVKTVFSESTSILGDVNGDRIINVKDATLIQKILAKVETPTQDMRERADVNKDGTVNINDASLIQKYVAEIVTGF